MDGETGCTQTWLYYECHYVGVVSSNFFNHVMRTADIAQSADRSESESAASIEQARISMQISWRYGKLVALRADLSVNLLTVWW